MTAKDKTPGSRWMPWLRFLVGLVSLFLLIGFFASGYTPPGAFGEVLRHNRENNIDASPFLYGDVENISAYEKAVKKLRKAARERQLESVENHNRR